MPNTLPGTILKEGLCRADLLRKGLWIWWLTKQKKTLLQPVTLMSRKKMTFFIEFLIYWIEFIIKTMVLNKTSFDFI